MFLTFRETVRIRTSMQLSIRGYHLGTLNKINAISKIDKFEKDLVIKFQTNKKCLKEILFLSMFR